MKILSSHFLSGANVYHRESVLVVTCDLAGMPELLDLIAKSPAGGVRMIGGENSLAQALRPLEFLWQRAAATGKPLLEQILGVTLALQSNLTVAQSLTGKILQISGSRMAAAVQCDAGAVGLAAWQLAVMSGYFFLTAPRSPERQEKRAQALSAQCDNFCSLAKVHSFDQPTLAMIRAAVKRDIPWFHADSPRAPVQFGHGKYRRYLTVGSGAVDRLFPSPVPSRIPTVAVTGSIGKTTTCRMVAHILAASGKCVGLSTTQGMYLDGAPIRLGDHATGTAARHLLMQPRLEAGVFEIARGGLIKRGLTIDNCDVGAVLNVLDNHLGLDGVKTREDLARVKRLVAENARELVVLNADDPLCLAMREHVRSRRLCLFSARVDNPAVEAHRAGGGCCVVIEGKGASACIVLTEGGVVCGTLPVREIPATLEGIAMAKAVNAAFAVALAHGLGVPFHAVAEALGRFDSTYENNPGRQNFYRQMPFDVLVDWADGPEASRELATISSRVPVTGRRLLLITDVADRPDGFIVDTGKAASAAADFYFCSNYTDLRGRAPGAVPGLLRRGLMAGGVPEAKIKCIEDFSQALEEALGAAEAGDLLTVMSYESELVRNRIMACQARFSVGKKARA